MSSEFGEFDEFNNGFKKIIQRMMSELERVAKTGNLKGRWEISEIDGDGMKGYRIQGQWGSDPSWGPLDPSNPFEPPSPVGPRAGRQRSFDVPRSISKETQDPLMDIFEDEKTIKIYFEVRGADKNDIQLNVTQGKVEIKARNLYRIVDLPTSSVNLEKTSSRCKNGVLEVTIPKKVKPLKSRTRKIHID